MEDSEGREVEGFESLPLRYAWAFLGGKGFAREATQIKESKDKYKSFNCTLKRAKIIDLLVKNGLLQEFVDTWWQNGNTESGKSKIRRYQRIYDGFTGAGDDSEEQEEESAAETTFAYEDDLRDYLARNLSKVEPGLKLFVDAEGQEGIEYPIDQKGRRVDILALDRDGVPVVIELKVSQGHEKVIGQALYYKNRAKEIASSERARIAIVAREISPELKIAVKGLPDCDLFEYALSINLTRIVASA